MPVSVGTYPTCVYDFIIAIHIHDVTNSCDLAWHPVPFQHCSLHLMTLTVNVVRAATRHAKDFLVYSSV